MDGRVKIRYTLMLKVKSVFKNMRVYRIIESFIIKSVG